MSEDLLPPFLHNIDPLEPEDIALQVALLTMEMASFRAKLAALSRLLTEAGQVVSPDLLLSDEPRDV